MAIGYTAYKLSLFRESVPQRLYRDTLVRLASIGLLTFVVMLSVGRDLAVQQETRSRSAQTSFSRSRSAPMLSAFEPRTERSPDDVKGRSSTSVSREGRWFSSTTDPMTSMSYGYLRPTS